MRGKTFIISGPSGVGKSTVLSALLEKRKNLYFSVSATTRDPRPGELDGIHYHFMDAESFRKWIAMDQFLEYAEYVGNFYGTPKRFVDEAMDKGQDVILDIEVQGALQVTSKRPDTVKIAQLEGAGTPSEGPRHRRSGESAEASAPGQGGVPDRPYLRLFCHQRYGGGCRPGAGRHHHRRALQTQGAYVCSGGVTAVYSLIQ